jgi:ABC-type transport system substrate-binding protein/class 3 adenylate cyclase
MSVTAGARRVVSVLVADIAGSTPIAEKLGPERYKFLFDDLIRLMREEVERFDGTVAQLTGDGVLALFGAPVAHEDDSERAVRTALAIREAIDRYAVDVAAGYEIELGARVAVNTGLVVIPASDAPPHELYNALGETVTIAARLQTLGDLVVGPATAHQVERVFALEPLGDVALKGKSEPVAAFRVVGVREGAAVGVVAAFVGRERELQNLCERLDGLLEGRGAIVSISGEPGIGKSRIVAEAEERFSGRVRFVAGHAVPYAETIPYWPVRSLLRNWLGLGASDPEAQVRLELRAELAETLGAEADKAYPFVAGLLGLSLGAELEQRIGDFAPDAIQRQTFDWLHQLVVSISGEQPLCLVLEDLHWSDDATLALVDDLLPAAEQTTVCFLLVHRSDPDHPAWKVIDRAGRRFRGLFHDLALEPLADADAQTLAAADAGGELPAELAALLAERAGGNPFFVGEAVRDLLERGALRRESGRLVLVGDISVPAAVQGALQARLDRLDPDAHELVTTAAVIGHTFGLPLLERVLPQARLRTTLSELQWLQLVVEERGGAAPEYRFRHGLVQEVAYGSLVEVRRRGLHLLVGEALEAMYRESVDEVSGLLAHHFAEADEPERAADYLVRAGDAARAAYAEPEAIELYRRALGFMSRAGNETQARRTLLRLALTHHLASDYAAAKEAFDRAFDLPAPAPLRLEPTERLSMVTPPGWPVEGIAPGHSDGSDLAEWVTSNLFRGLVAIGRDLEIEPDLAERFTVSADGRTYRFVLRPDARWSDGVPVSAGDFEFTFTRMLEEEPGSPAGLDEVHAIAVDDRTLELRLVRPRSHFLHLLGQPMLFAWPRHVHEREGTTWYRHVPLVGSGPFVLESRETAGVPRERGRIVLASARDWYGPCGNVGRVELELEPSPADAGERWRQGEYDVVYEFLAEVADLSPDEMTVVQRTPGGMTDYLGMVATRPPLDDSSIRRAVAHAVDRQAIPLVLGQTAAVTGGVVPPAIPGHSHRVAPAYDPERARALIQEAERAGRDEPEEIMLAHFAIQSVTASVIAEQLTAVGLRVRLMPTRSNVELAAAIDRANAYIWAAGYVYPDPGGLLEPLLEWNSSLYRDAALERLLERATGSHDRDERLRASREFERLWIGEHAAVVPLTYDDCRLWRRPWVTGLWANGVARSTFAEAVVTGRPESAEVPT